MTATNDKIVETAREELHWCEESDRHNREEAVIDARFEAGDPWDSTIRSERESLQLPCITVNFIPQFVRQITGEARQNKKSIKFHPTGSGANDKTAEVLNGLIRSIEIASRADLAYTTALEGAARVGWGWWRVMGEYVDDTSLTQDLRIVAIRDPLSVVIDPAAQSPTAADAQIAFISTMIGEAEAKRMYPKAKFNQSEFAGLGRQSLDWYHNIDGGYYRICEYLKLDTKKVEHVFFVLPTDGRTISMPVEEYAQFTPEEQSKLPLIGTRKVSRTTTKWRVISGLEVLEEVDWPGRYLPIVRCVGEERIVEGRVVRMGLTRPLRGPSEMYNYWASAATMAVSHSSTSPWLMTVGQIQGNEALWAEPSRAKVLVYNPDVADNGQSVPRPERVPGSPIPTGAVEMMGRSLQDMYGVTGIYPANLGARSNETSGRAIAQRDRQSDTGSFFYHDNQSYAIEQGGRIILDLVPHFYDVSRLVQLTGEDGSVSSKEINVDAETALAAIQHGQYAVTVSSGPSFSTRRQENADTMYRFYQTFPPAAAATADLYAKALELGEDWTKRLETIVPPEAKAATAPEQIGPDGKPVPAQPPIPPEVQNALKQSEDRMKELEAEVEDLESKLRKTTTPVEVALINQETTLRAKAMELLVGGELKAAEWEIEQHRLRQEEQMRIAAQESELPKRSEPGSASAPVPSPPQMPQLGSEPPMEVPTAEEMPVDGLPVAAEPQPEGTY